MKMWDKVQVEQMQDAQKACHVLGKLWIQMVGRLHVREIRDLLQSEAFTVVES